MNYNLELTANIPNKDLPNKEKISTMLKLDNCVEFSEPSTSNSFFCIAPEQIRTPPK